MFMHSKGNAVTIKKRGFFATENFHSLQVLPRNESKTVKRAAKQNN